MPLWQFVLFECDSQEDLRSLLLGLSSVATLREGTGFYFFSQLPGEAEFQFDCELVSGGLITSRTGAYFAFLGHFIDSLASRFGALELGEHGAIPGPDR